MSASTTKRRSSPRKDSRPTGIIRTLPWYGAEDSRHTDTEKGKAYKRMMRHYKLMDKGRAESCVVALPAIEVLHCYILIGGVIRVRANISEWISGADIGEVKCWDDSTRTAKWWVVLTAPVSWPPYEIKMTGFQGFRYVYEELW